MAHRHEVQKAGGGGVSQFNGKKRGNTPLGAGNKNVAEESKQGSKAGAIFKKAGGPIEKEVGGVVGKKAGGRLDKRARGGATKSPFSSAHQKGG